MKKSFTLIELIIAVVVIGILAAIVIPNISEQKTKSLTSMVNGNIRIIQTAVDTYSLKNNGNLPVFIAPTPENPQTIDIDRLYPKYIKSTPDYDKLKNQKYWVDAFGTVWGATADSPSNVYAANNSVEWSHIQDAKAYNVYEIERNKSTGKATGRKILLSRNVPIHDLPDKVKVEINGSVENVLISSIDEYGLESAPAGPTALLNQDWFTPILKKEGTFEFEMVSKEIMYWDGYRAVKDEPEGTSITFEFAVMDNKGQYGEFVADFNQLTPSKGIKIKVVSKGFEGQLPSLYDLQVFYHFKIENRILGTSTVRENVGPHGLPIDKTKPVRAVDEFVLPPNNLAKEIIVQDDYNRKDRGKVTYTYNAGGKWYPVISISDIPKGSTIRVEREYQDSVGVIVRNPILEPTEALKVAGEEKPETEWTTLNQMAFHAQTSDGQPTDWIRAEISDVKPVGTRIVYKYWNEFLEEEVDSIGQLSDSSSMRVTAYLQVLTSELGKVAEPEVKSIRIIHERGAIDLSLILPTATILPIKSNNANSKYFSPETKVNWTYDARDPRNLKIIDVEWLGSLQESYPVGTHEVKLRVLNEANYWSKWVTYKFEVKPEKPVAVIKSLPATNIKTNTPITWLSKDSYDPDGDGIANVEWENKLEQYTSEGTHTIKLRVQDAEGYWSDWVEHTFTVAAAFEIKRMSAGLNHNLFLLENGQVKAYGSNNYGQLGSTNDRITRHDLPLSDVSDVAAGQYNSFALHNDGTVSAWGYNATGQLGLGDNVKRMSPEKIPNLTNVKKVAVSDIDSRAVFFLLNDGTVMASGSNVYNKLANPLSSYNTNNVPVKVEGLSGVKDIIVTHTNVYAILSNGDVMAWGVTYGKAPVIAHELRNAVQVQEAYSKELVLYADGTVFGRGKNHSLIFGVDTPYTTTTLNQIKGIPSIKEVQLYAGSSSAVLVLLSKEGQVYTLGANDGGLLGVGSTHAVQTPILVGSNPDNIEVSGVKNLSVRSGNVFALRGDGSFYWWGHYNAPQKPRVGDWYKVYSPFDPSPF